MRVGLDYRSALVNREGIGRTTRELARALSGYGLDEDLRLYAWTLQRAALPRAELGLDEDVHLSRVRFPSRWIEPLCRWTRRGVDDYLGGVDVFHHSQPVRLPVRHAAETCMVYDCIWSRDTGSISRAAATAMEQAIRNQIAHARLVFAPTKTAARDIESVLGVDPKRIRITPLGCDHVLRDLPHELRPARTPYILIVSRVDGRKNHTTLLRAFEQLVADGLPQRLIIAGPDGHGSEQFAAQLDQSPARERVLRLRDVPDADLPALYAGAAAFAFPSLDEGFGLPPLEAMACGAPVVASDIACLRETLDPAAVLVPALDADGLADALRQILLHPEYADELRALGRARARGYTWRMCAADMLSAWRELSP